MGIPKITKEKAEKLLGVCRRVLNMKGGPGIRLVNNPNGITVMLDQNRRLSGDDTIGRNEMWAKITDAGTLVDGVYRYTWTEVEPTPTGWQNLTGGESSTAGGSQEDDTRAINALHPTARCYLKVDTVLKLSRDIDSAGKIRYNFEFARPKTIAVSLTQDGGSNGTVSTRATYTYKWPVDIETSQEIKNADDSRATGLSPEFTRDIGEFNVGDRGVIYFDSSNNPKLLTTDEDEQVCE